MKIICNEIFIVCSCAYSVITPSVSSMLQSVFKYVLSNLLLSHNRNFFLEFLIIILRRLFSIMELSVAIPS